MLSYRNLNVHDIPICICIMKENYPDDYHHWYKILNDDIQDVLNKKYRSNFLLVLKENNIVGFGCQLEIKSDIYKLSWINIAPAYKKQGIGTELVKQLEEDVLKNISKIKFKKISFVLETDKPSFYNKIGYTTFQKENIKDYMVKTIYS